MTTCDDFQLITERVFAAFFVEHNFKRVGVPLYGGEDRKAGGPLCAWFYESPECRFKFHHGDGEVNLLLGSPTTHLTGIYEDNDWHYVRSLVSSRPSAPGIVDDEAMLAELLNIVQSNYPNLLQGLIRKSAI